MRVKALTFIEWLVTKRSKSLAKMRLLPQILQLLFGIISTETELEEDEDDCDEPYLYALTVLDCVVSYVPSEISFPPIVRSKITFLLFC